jgi:alkyl hydroperoxide reductase subunit AhpC
MDCLVATLSVDPVTSHNKWLKDVIAQSEDEPISSIDFPIIADVNRDIATAYGMIDPWTSDRQELPLTIRCVFIINPEHKLMLSLNYPACVGRNMTEIVRCVKALQLSYQKSVATPANWPHNHKTVTLRDGTTTSEFEGGVFLLPTVSSKEADEHYPGYHTCIVPSAVPYLRLVKASEVGQLPNDNPDNIGCGIEKAPENVKRKEKLGVFAWFRGGSSKVSTSFSNKTSFNAAKDKTAPSAEASTRSVSSTSSSAGTSPRSKVKPSGSSSDRVAATRMTVPSSKVKPHRYASDRETLI